MAEKTELLEEDEKVVEIELERLRGFENHPFKVRADSQMIELQESIRKYGILNPLIVRPKKDGCYEIISGHRRKFAAEKIGYRKVPVIIRVLKDDEAVVSMVGLSTLFQTNFLGYFPDIVQAFDTLGRNVYGDDYTSLHNPIVLSSVLLV